MSYNKINAMSNSPWVISDNTKKRITVEHLEAKLEILNNHLASTCIIKGGKWVFLSNRIVAYWPFSINSSNGNKTLSFKLLSPGLIISIVYTLVGIFHVVNFIWNEVKYIVDLSENQLDAVCSVMLDVVLVTCLTMARIYGVLALPKFKTFWEQIQCIVTQYISIASHTEIEKKFSQLNKWSLKWVLVFTLLGICLCSINIVYFNTVNINFPLVTEILYMATTMIGCTHSCSSFILLFFSKIIGFGFSVCKMEIEKLGTNVPSSSGDHDHRHEARRKTRSFKLEKIFKLLNDLELCNSQFNNLFGFNLFIDTILCFLTLMVAMFSLYIQNKYDFIFVTYAILQIVCSSLCFVCVCMGGSQITKECLGMSQKFQEIPSSSISIEDAHKIQLIVQRLSARPSGMYVAHLYQIQQSLLCSALNILATYFVVLIQLRPSVKANLIDTRNQTVGEKQ
ncbi:unnamed protein product [Orchesella dallaii]|uniref:Gustatory receptor n=1 Tax=Orchesella dallaii TaxID=48710 RepID=A0ABP1Q1F8_9HEXA